MCLRMEEPISDAVKRQRIDANGSSVRLTQPPTPTHQYHHSHRPSESLVLPPLPPGPSHEYASPPGHRYPPAQGHPPQAQHPSYSPGHHARPPPPPSQPYPPHMAHEQYSSYDHRNGTYASQERPPPTDTNPLHRLTDSATHSPEAKPMPALESLKTSFSSEPRPYSHHSQTSPPAYPPPPPSGPPPHVSMATQQHPQQPHPQPPAPQTPGTPAYPHQSVPIQPQYDPGHVPPPQPIYPEVQQRGPPYSAGPYGPPMPWAGAFPQQPLPTGQTPASKRGSRAVQACETCRQRKAKCDEGKPSCGYCKESRTACVYKENPPAKVDRAQKEILDSLKENKDNYNAIKASVDRLNERFHVFDNYWRSDYLKSLSEMSEFVKALKDYQTGVNRIIPGPADHVSFNHHPQSHPSMDAIFHPQQFMEPADHRSAVLVDEMVKVEGDMSAAHVDPSDDDTGGAGRKTGQVVMANRLLHWPSIKDLLGNAAPREDYVAKDEELKGSLRAFGRGQGKDLYDGARSKSPFSPIASAGDESNSRSSCTPISEDSRWGGRDLGLPNMPGGKFFQDGKQHLGGLTREGRLKLDKKTMCTLMDSYLTNIHILHPFLDQKRLQRMVERVWREYNPSEAAGSQSPFVPGTPHPVNGKLPKRKRSIVAVSSDDRYARSPTGPLSPGRLSCRISTAIVLFVMALGKICQYKDPLPGFAPETFPTNPSESGQTNSAKPSTPNRSSSSTGRDLIGIYGSERRSVPVSIHDRGMRPGDRNMDVVPGLAYFAEATSTISHFKAPDLSLAQAHLLAAIYTAQLACVTDSYSHISEACRVCCILVSDTKFEHARDMKEVDQIKFVYLACLQMESDILAELDWQPSLIRTIDPKGEIGVPKGIIGDVDDVMEMESMVTQQGDMLPYYTFQLFLRKCMNDWQQSIYPASTAAADYKFVLRPNNGLSIQTRDANDGVLQQIRGMMQDQPLLAWQETDEPATSINAARLRGKYYGAKYLLHRQFLRYALHHFTTEHVNMSVQSLYEDFKEHPEKYELKTELVNKEWIAKSRTQPDGVTTQDWITFEYLISCHMCVAAAMQSTIAFDGVLRTKRLMVTNLFGTAHAQFGNMLVLSAVRASRVLNFLITRHDHDRLMNRTIDFLQSLAPISSTLKRDAELLSIIRDKIHDGHVGPTDYSVNPSASFGSTGG